MTHALSFVSMGVEARCHPSKSTAHHCHMKRQPFLCNGCPCRGRRHFHCRCYLHRCCQLRRRRRRRRRRNCPSPLPLPSAIAVAVAVNHCRRHLCRVAINHCCCRCPCHQPLPSLSPSSIAVAIPVDHHHCHAVGHFWELFPWRGKNCIQPSEAEKAYLILPYFILFVQWAAHWSKPDDWPGVKRQWPTPALGGERQAVSG